MRLKPSTRGIIISQDLAHMQPRSLLVNTSRSGLVAPGAQEALVAKGEVFSAIDVCNRGPRHKKQRRISTKP